MQLTYENGRGCETSSGHAGPTRPYGASQRALVAFIPKAPPSRKEIVKMYAIAAGYIWGCYDRGQAPELLLHGIVEHEFCELKISHGRPVIRVTCLTCFFYARMVSRCRPAVTKITSVFRENKRKALEDSELKVASEGTRRPNLVES